MERLTVRDDEGRVALVCREDCKGGPACFVCEQNAIDRLAAYEDTGLEPEAVKEHEAAYIELMTRTYGPLHQKIGQWLQAEQDGRLVVLPCKVGDVVFRVLTPTLRIIEREIRTIGEAANVSRCLGDHSLIVQVYLTRQEAEAAVERLKGEGAK